MAESLTKQIARMVDATSFACRPSTYGLKTRKEFMERTMAGAGQRIAMRKARVIIKLVRAAISSGERT